MNLMQIHVVTLYKSNGETCSNIKAHVQLTKIFIDVKGNVQFPPIEAGDIIEHKQSNGITEQYQVLDPCYYDVPGTFGKHYQCKVRKLSAIERHQAQMIFNINASQANVATDNASISATQNIGFDMGQVKTLIDAVRCAIPADILQEDKDVITDGLEVVEEQLSKPAPKKSVMTTILTGIKAVAGTVEFGAAVAALIQFVQTTF